MRKYKTEYQICTMEISGNKIYFGTYEHESGMRSGSVLSMDLPNRSTTRFYEAASHIVNRRKETQSEGTLPSQALESEQFMKTTNARKQETKISSEKGYRIPSEQHRSTSFQVLDSFAKSDGMPLTNKLDRITSGYYPESSRKYPVITESLIEGAQDPSFDTRSVEKNSKQPESTQPIDRRLGKHTCHIAHEKGSLPEDSELVQPLSRTSRAEGCFNMNDRLDQLSSILDTQVSPETSAYQPEPNCENDASDFVSELNILKSNNDITVKPEIPTIQENDQPSLSNLSDESMTNIKLRVLYQTFGVFKIITSTDFLLVLTSGNILKIQNDCVTKTLETKHMNTNGFISSNFVYITDDIGSVKVYSHNLVLLGSVKVCEHILWSIAVIRDEIFVGCDCGNFLSFKNYKETIYRRMGTDIQDSSYGPCDRQRCCNLINQSTEMAVNHDEVCDSRCLLHRKTVFNPQPLFKNKYRIGFTSQQNASVHAETRHSYTENLSTNPVEYRPSSIHQHHEQEGDVSISQDLSAQLNESSMIASPEPETNRRNSEKEASDAITELSSASHGYFPSMACQKPEKGPQNLGKEASDKITQLVSTSDGTFTPISCTESEKKYQCSEQEKDDRIPRIEAVVGHNICSLNELYETLDNRPDPHFSSVSLVEKRSSSITCIRAWNNNIYVSSYDKCIRIYHNKKVLLKTVEVGSPVWDLVLRDNLVVAVCMYDGIKLYNDDFTKRFEIPSNDLVYCVCVIGNEMLEATFYEKNLIHMSIPEIG